jgi:hypothetical protein
VGFLFLLLWVRESRAKAEQGTNTFGLERAVFLLDCSSLVSRFLRHSCWIRAYSCAKPEVMACSARPDDEDPDKNF